MLHQIDGNNNEVFNVATLLCHLEHGQNTVTSHRARVSLMAVIFEPMLI